MQKAKVAMVAMLALGGVLAAQAQSTSSTATMSPKHKHKVEPKKSGPTVEEQIKELREQTQAQIDSLKQQLADRDAKLQAAQDAAAAAASQASAAASQAQAAAASASSSSSAVSSLQGAVDDLKTTTATVQTAETELKKHVEEPQAIHYKQIKITPGGFFEGATVYRQRGIGGDINTQFTGIPYSGVSQGTLSEFNMSARQSRLSLAAEAKNGSWAYKGYVEGDFLSAGVTSNSNESNSYTMRLRQGYGQATNNGFTFAGGQMWSLLTENKKGIENGNQVTPLTIDPQYNAGFVWTRAPGLRAVKSFGDKFAIGISAEQAQTTNVTCHAPSTAPVLCDALSYQVAGNTGGLYDNQSNYSFNKLPDFIGKIAIDPGFGHYEIEGIISSFRDRYFPNAIDCYTGTPAVYAPCAAGAVGATNLSTSGGGLGASARWSLANKKIDFGYKILAGAGIERYGTSTLPEVIVKPTGALEPLRGGSSLATLELHPTPRFDLYSNFGVDYAERTIYNIGGTDYGYGSPNQKTTGCQTELTPTAGGGAGGSGSTPTSAGSCTADNRAIGELTFGYWYRFYKGPMGTVQQGMQYSYAERATWAGTGGSPKATDGMWWTSFRYYLP
jgi:hypothetical protein